MRRFLMSLVAVLAIAGSALVTAAPAMAATADTCIPSHDCYHT